MAESFSELMEENGGQWAFLNNYPSPNCGPFKCGAEDGKEMLFWSADPEVSRPHKTFVTLSQKTANAGYIDMAPGGYGPFDVHPQADEVFVCLEGTATVVCGDLTKDVHPGEMMYCPTGMKHRFYNFTDKFCRVFFVICGEMT